MKRVQQFVALSLAGLGTLGALLVAQVRGRSEASPTSSFVTASEKKPGWRQIKNPWAPGEQMQTEATVLFKAGRIPEAEEKCRQALAFLRRTPIAQEPRELLGDIQLAKGQYKEALESYGVARRYSANPRLSLNVALCYVRLGDLKMAQHFCPDEALAHLVSAPLQELPGTQDLSSMEARILYAHGVDAYMTAEAQEALKSFQAAERLAPANWWIAYMVGRSLDRLNRSDEAVPYYKRAIHYGGNKVPQGARRRAEALK